MSVVEPIVVSERVAGPAAEVTLVVPNDLDYFRGHFPDVPVVPGVVQIKWALLLARRYLGVAGAFTGMEALKFQKVMRPGSRVTLALEYGVDKGKLRFSFDSEQGRHSSGRLLLRATP